MPNFDNMTDREILLDVKRHEALAKAGVAELMRRAVEEPIRVDA